MPTENDNLSCGDGNLEFSAKKKRHFSIKDYLRAGVRLLKSSPWLFALTIVLSSLSLSFIGSSLAMTSVREIDALTQAIQDRGSGGVTFYFSSYSDDGWNEDDFSKKVKDEVLNYGAHLYTPERFDLNFDTSCSLYGHHPDINYDGNGYYVSPSEEALSINQKFLDDNHLEMAYGVLPQEKTEIALSLHAFYSLQDFGFVDAVDKSYNLKPQDDIKPEDVLNHYISGVDYISGDLVYYKLVGLIDTQFDEDTYGKYRKISYSNDFYDQEEYRKMGRLLSNSLHEMVFIYDSGEAPEEMYHSFFCSDESKSSEAYRYSVGYYPSHEHTLFFDDSKTSLQGDEILVSSERYFHFLTYGIYSKKQTYQPEDAYFDLAKTRPISFEFYNRENLYRSFIPETATYQLAAEKYLDFKDSPLFKIFYENQQTEKYGGYYDNSYYKDATDKTKFVYPWEDDTSYVLTSKDKEVIYHCFRTYLYNIWNLKVTDATYYSDLTALIASLTTDYDNHHPYTPDELDNYYQEMERTTREEYLLNHAESIYDQYKDHPIYQGLYKNQEKADTAKKDTLDYLIDLKVIPEIRDDYLKYLIAAYKDSLKGKTALVEMERSFDLYNEDKTFKIVGIDFDLTNRFQRALSLSTSAFDEYTKYWNIKSTYLFNEFLMLIPQEEESIRNVVNFVEKFNETYDYNSYSVKNGVPHAYIGWRTESLSDIHYEVYDLQSNSLSYLIGGILLAVTALAIFILYLMKIKKKQWNFRLVENQVEDKKGVAKIVSVQCLFVALISYVISVLVMNLIVLNINLGIKASSSVDIFLIYTPIGSYFLMLGVSLLMAVLVFIFVWIFYLREKKLDQARTQE